MNYQNLVLFSYLIVLANCLPTSEDEYTAAIRSTIDQYAQISDTGYQFAITSQKLNYTYAAGLNDHKT